MRRYILTLSCPDRMGIVAAVAGFLLKEQCNIIDSAQFGDDDNQLFFMRVYFTTDRDVDATQMHNLFSTIATEFNMRWAIHDANRKHRLILLVSKFGHCLNDLLYRHRIGALPIEIPAIVSNHRDFYQLAASHNIPFHFLPVTEDNK